MNANAMTVGELIEVLKEFPRDCYVDVSDAGIAVIVAESIEEEEDHWCSQCEYGGGRG